MVKFRKFPKSVTPPLKVLKPTVSRESFWNHGIKEMVRYNIYIHFKWYNHMFHSILDVFSTKNGYQKNKNIRTPEPPPPLFRAKS